MMSLFRVPTASHQSRSFAVWFRATIDPRSRHTPGLIATQRQKHGKPIEINCSHPQSQSQSQPRYQFAAARTITSRRHYHHNFSPLLHLASDPTKEEEETESQSQRHDDEHEYSGDGVSRSSNADLLSHKVLLENEMNKTSTHGELECYFGLKCQFDHGDDIEKGSDMARAIDWYTKAAEQGNLFAMAILQYCYMRGLGVEKDFRIALDFMNELSEQSMQRQQRQNDDGGSGEFEKNDLAFQFLERQMGATGGRPVDPMLHYLMGVCYYGGFGVEACETTAVEWFRLAAEQGDVVTQSFLGVFYYRGIVVEQSEAEAAKWIQLAAEHGDVLAFVGACYHLSLIHI